MVRRTLILLPVLSWPGLARADAFPLQTLMNRLAAVNERRATFRETRRFAALTDTLISQGHLFYRRPDYLEKVTDWPQPERLVVDGSRLVLTEANDPPRVVDLGGQPELRAMVEGMRGPLAGDLGALQRLFRIDTAGDLTSWGLTMTPQDARSAKLVRVVQVAGQGDAIREVRVIQANGDEQLMQIGPPS